MKIDGLLPQQFFQIQSRTALEGLSVGDLIQGRVTALDNGLLLVTLLDGSSFSANIPEGYDVPPGTLLTLQIGERAGDQITARIVRMDTPERSNNQISQITRQLQALNIKPSEVLVSSVLDLLDENPGLGIDKASFLAANGMESDPAMLETVAKLANREFDLNQNLQTLSRILEDTLSGADRVSQESLLRPLLLEQEAEQAVREMAGRLIELHNETSKEGIPLGQEAKLFLARQLHDALSGSITGHEPLDEGRVFDTLQSVFSNLSQGKNPLSGGLNIEDNPIREVLGDFIEVIQRVAAKTGELFKQESPDIKKIINNFFEKAYVRAEDGDIRSIDLKEKAEVLKKVLSLAADTAMLTDEKGGQAIRPLAQELTDALRFFSQVNTYHVFMHVPLIINQHQTTGELYIMKRRARKGRIDPNQFTLFISLNTQNLGLIETFLNASSRYVTIHFRVGSSHLADFVRAQRKDLYEALEKKGYKLAEMKCRVFEDEPINLLNAGEATESVLGMNARVDLRV